VGVRARDVTSDGEKISGGLRGECSDDRASKKAPKKIGDSVQRI